MDSRRTLEDLVVQNDNPVFQDAFVKAFEKLRSDDACATLARRGIYDTIGTSWYLTNLSIQAVPDLPQVLTAAEPPSFDWFLSLPSLYEPNRSVLEEHVLVYALCLQKPGADDKTYFGCAFSIYTGCKTRVYSYHTESLTALSQHTKNAIDNGYTIVHLGALFLIKLPFEQSTPYAHSGVLGLETWSTCHFWGFYRGVGPNADGDAHYLRHLCPWDIDNIPYGGLCSHSALMDPLTNGPPGMYEGFETVQRLREEREMNRKKAMVAINQRDALAKVMAASYKRGENCDIVDGFGDEDVRAMVDRGLYLLEKDRKYREAPEHRGNLEARQNKYWDSVREGKKLIEGLTQGTPAVAANSGEVNAGVVLTDEQVDAIRKGNLRNAHDRAASGQLKQGRSLLQRVAAGKLAREFSDLLKDPEVGRLDIPLATDDENVLIDKATVHNTSIRKGAKKTHAGIREGRRLLKEVAAGRLAKDLVDVPVDPETGYSFNVPVATAEQLKWMGQTERNIANSEEWFAKRKEGGRLLKEVAEGRLATNLADVPVDPETGDFLDVPVATAEQLKWMEQAEREIAVTRKNNAKGNANAKEGRRLLKEVAEGRLAKDLADVPVDPETGYSFNVPVATAEQLKRMEQAESAAASCRKACAGEKEGRRLLHEVTAGRLIRDVADKLVDPETGEVVDVPVATTDQLKWMAVAVKRRDAGELLRAKKRKIRRAAAGKENVKPASDGTEH